MLNDNYKRVKTRIIYPIIEIDTEEKLKDELEGNNQQQLEDSVQEQRYGEENVLRVSETENLGS
jgi:hypothetical protein